MREQKGVYSHMITDHYHYFHKGGYGYHTLFNPLYDIEKDPEFKNPLSDPELVERYTEKLKELLKRYEAPECQYKRLDLI